MKLLFRLTLLLTFFFFPLNGEETFKTPLDAAKDFFSTSGEPIEGKTPSYMEEFFNMLLTLGFVIGLIFVTVWFLKRLSRTRVRQLNRGTGIKILERRALNQKSSLYLIDVLGKAMVISESPSGIHLITEFAEGTDLELRLEEEYALKPERSSIVSSFQNKIKKFMKPNA